jgi:hypothetical protein
MGIAQDLADGTSRHLDVIYNGGMYKDGLICRGAPASISLLRTLSRLRGFRCR